jgi:quercetin dioxygenase-like cupin family protein
MEVFQFEDEPGTPIEAHGSAGANLSAISGQGPPRVACIRLGPGGVLGRHAAGPAQLFVVVQGDGVVTGGDGEPVRIAAGEAAFWAAGEAHETRSDSGLTAIVIEADGLTRR